MNIKVSIVRLFPQSETLKAIVSVTLNDCFAVHGICIFNSVEKGIYVSMPRRKTPSGEAKDVFHPINKEARAALVDAIFSEYAKFQTK